MSEEKSIEYGVARKGSQRIIGSTFPTVEQAERHLAWVNGQIASLGEESNARLVYVEVTTSRSTPKVYVPPKDDEPEQEPEESEPATAPAASDSGEASA